MKPLYYFTIFTTLLSCSLAFGQGADESPAGVMISHGHPKGQWMVTYNYMSQTMKTNLAGSGKIGDDAIFLNYIMAPQKMKMDMHMFMVMGGLTGKLSVMATFNYNVLSMDMNMLPGSMMMHGMGGETSDMMTSKTSGLGDIRLIALYKLTNGEGSSLVLSGGLSIPTGSINITGGENIMYDTLRLPYMMQTGTGSLDFLPGLTYLKKSGKITWSAQALSNLRVLNNSAGYHYGSDLTLNAWASYRFCPYFTASLRAENFYGGMISGKDSLIYQMMEPDANPQNYGGDRLNIHLGCNFYINKGAMQNSKIGLEFGLPVIQNLNGPQLATQFTLNAVLSKSF